MYGLNVSPLEHCLEFRSHVNARSGHVGHGDVERSKGILGRRHGAHIGIEDLATHRVQIYCLSASDALVGALKMLTSRLVANDQRDLLVRLDCQTQSVLGMREEAA